MKTRLLPLLLLPSLASAATRSWDAGGASNVWTTAANWDAAVVAGDTLIFPAGLAAGDLAMTNDFGSGTNWAALRFEAGGYSVGGNAFTIGATGIDINAPASAAAVTITPGVTLSAGNGWIVTDNNDTLTLNGSVNLNGSPLSLTENGNVVFNGGISGTGAGSAVSVGALGDAPEVLFDNSGSFSHAGTTTVVTGTLIVDGVVSASTVRANQASAAERGVLGGRGSVHTLTSSGGTVSPGAQFAGTALATNRNVGTLTVTTGGATFSATTTFDAHFQTTTAGTGHSRLAVTGAVNLAGATLTVADESTFNPGLGDEFFIITNDGADAVTGTFAGLAEAATINGGRFIYQVRYARNSAAAGTGNDVSLTVVDIIPTGVVKIWDGSTDNAFATGTNWNANTLPVSGDRLSFTHTASTFAVVLAAGSQPGAKVFESTAFSIAPYVVSGNGTLRLKESLNSLNTSGVTAFMDNGGGVIPSLEFIASTTAPELSQSGSGMLRFDGRVTSRSSFPLEVRPIPAGSRIDFNDDFDMNAGGVTFGSAAGTDAGLSVIEDAQTFPGPVDINPGVSVQIKDGSALGSAGAGTTVGGTLIVDMDHPSTAHIPITVAEPLIIEDTGEVLARDGDHTLTGAVTLGAFGTDATISTDGATDSWTITGAVSGVGADLNYDGPGTVDLTGTAVNSYTGHTRVQGGLVRLNRTGAGVAIPAVCIVQGGELRHLASNQIADTLVQVGGAAGAAWVLGGFSESIQRLALVHSGSVSISAGGELILTADCNQADFESGTRTISGGGVLGFTNPAGQWHILDTPDADDLTITIPLQSRAAGAKSIKRGTGTLRVTDTAQGSDMPFDIEAGTVRWDPLALNGFTPGDVRLNGATARLAGRGSLGDITVLAGGGTIEPMPASGAGTENLSGDVITLNSATTLKLDFGIVTGQTQSDSLIVDGNINLGGATLALTVLGAPAVGDQFTIIYNSSSLGVPVVGTFAGLPEGAQLLVGGQEYRISYQSGIDGLHVTLTRFEPNSGFTRTWDGGGANNNWTTAANWVGDVVPGPGDALVFPNGAPDPVNTNNFAADTHFRSISIAGNSPYTLGGNALILNEGITVSGNGHALNMPISCALDQTWSVGQQSSVTIGGTVNTNDVALTLATNAAGPTRPATMTINGIISGDPSVVRKTGSGTLVLNAANTFTSNTHIFGGTVEAATATATGTEPTSIDGPGAVLELTGPAYTRTDTVGIFEGTLRQPAGANSHTISGQANFGTAGIIDIDAATLTLSGTVAGSSPTVTGAGTLVLSGTASNLYSGTFTRSGGSMRLEKPAGTPAITGDLILQNAAADGNIEMTWFAANQIADSAKITAIRGGGTVLVNLNSNTETIRSLDLTGASVFALGSALTLGNGDIAVRASDNASSFFGNLNFGTSPLDLHIEDGAPATDFTVSGTLTGGTLTLHKKTGAGKVHFTSGGSFGGFNSSALDIVEGEVQADNIFGLNHTMRLIGGVLSGNGEPGVILSHVGGIIAPGASPGDLAADAITLNAATTLRMEFQNNTPGTGYDQLEVRTSALGAQDIALADATLELVPLAGFNPSIGQVYTIVDNPTAGTLTGTFAGLANNASVTAAPAVFRINYNAGTNTNDVTLTVTGITSTGITRTWDGGGGNDNWTTPANWAGDIAPGAGDSLTFPAGAARPLNNNNYPAGTTFDVITFDAGGYSITGNAVTINGGITKAATPSGSHVALSLPITIGSGQVWSNAGALTGGLLSLSPAGSLNLGGNLLSLTADGPISMQGVISGLPAGSLHKSGAGNAELTAANTYAGVTQVVSGTLLIEHDSSLGSTAGQTVVEAAATLQLNTPISLTIAEPFTLRGTLVSSVAVHTLTGNIILGSATATMDLFALGRLDVNGRISAGVTGAKLTRTGDGTLRLGGTLSNTWTGGLNITAGTVELNKTAGAVALPGDTVLRTGTSQLIALTDHQIADTATVTLRSSTAQYLSRTDTIGGLSFDGGTVNSGAGTLTLAGPLTAETTFVAGTLAGIVSIPAGEHVWDVSNNAAFAADFQVTAVVTGPGTIRKTGNGRAVFATLAHSVFGLNLTDGEVHWNGATTTALNQSGGLLTGTFQASSLTSTGGRVEPGTPALLTGSATINGPLFLGSGTTVQFQTGGLAVGQSDRFLVNGPVTLNNPALEVQLLGGFTPALTDSFTIVTNDGTDAITGTFAGLPEGAHLALSPTLAARASYTASTGNDFSLTRVNPPAGEITASAIVPGSGPNAGQYVATFQGTGIPGLIYRLEKSTDLITWITVSTTTAAPDGTWAFTALEPQTSPRTYYRITGP